MTTKEYLGTPETTQPREVTYGRVREPPAPFYGHQHVVLRIARLLADHVEPRGLGRVAVAPLDVVLDRERALIVQPDVLFVSAGRLSIIHDQVWGAPDLVVEVASPGTEDWDAREKFGWYRQYGVHEYWLVNPARGEIVIVDFTAFPPARHTALMNDTVESRLLPGLTVSAPAVFA